MACNPTNQAESQGLASDPEIAADRSKMLNCDGAGDEGGMMKCMFHVEDRHAICTVLAASDKTDFLEKLQSALVPLPDHLGTDGESMEAEASLNLVSV